MPLLSLPGVTGPRPLAAAGSPQPHLTSAIGRRLWSWTRSSSSSQMWHHSCRHRGQRCDDCAPFHFNLSCLALSVCLLSARWLALPLPMPLPLLQLLLPVHHGARTVPYCALYACDAPSQQAPPGYLGRQAGRQWCCRVSPGSQRQMRRQWQRQLPGQARAKRIRGRLVHSASSIRRPTAVATLPWPSL